MEANGEALVCETDKEEISTKKESPSETLEAASALKGKAEGSRPPSSEPRDSKTPSSEAQEFADANECSIEIPAATSKSSSPTSDSSVTDKTPLIVDIPEGARQIETFNSGSGSPSDRRMCLPCCEIACCYAFQRFTNKFFSPLTLPYYFLLLSLPVGTGYMALKYMMNCPVASNVPIIVFIIGILGVVYITGRILEIIYYWFLPGEPAWSLQSFFYVFSLGMIMLLIIVELLIMTVAHVNINDPESEHYCDPLFYHFCYFGGIFGLLVVGLSSAMILPIVMCS